MIEFCGKQLLWHLKFLLKGSFFNRFCIWEHKYFFKPHRTLSVQSNITTKMVGHRLVYGTNLVKSSLPLFWNHRVLTSYDIILLPDNMHAIAAPKSCFFILMEGTRLNRLHYSLQLNIPLTLLLLSSVVNMKPSDWLIWQLSFVTFSRLAP